MSRQLPSRTEASSFLFLLCQPRDHFKGDDLDVLRAVANTLATQSGSRVSGEQPSHARDKLCSSYSIESNRFQFLDLSLSLSLSLSFSVGRHHVCLHGLFINKIFASASSCGIVALDA